MPHDQRLTSYSKELDQSFPEIAHRMAVVEPVSREQVNLREYLYAILKRKWLVAGIVTITTLLVALHMYRLPHIYEALTTIRIEPRNESFIRSKDIVINTGSDPDYRRTQLRLLENPQLMRRLVLKLGLQHDPKFLDQASPNKAKPAVAPGTVEDLTVEQRAQLAPYVAALLLNLTFEPITGTNLVNIRFRHTDPAIAMSVTDTLARLFIENDTNQETQSTKNEATQIAKQLADLQISIKKLEEEKLDYIKNHELPHGEGKGQNLTAERLGALSSELLAAENERAKLQTQYEAIRQAANPWIIPQIQENRDVQELRVQIREMERKRTALLTKYTSAWPAVIQLEEELKQLKQELERYPQEIITVMRLRYEAALAREQKLRHTYQQERAIANQQSVAGIQLSDINQKLETDKQLFNSLFQRQKELEISSSGRSDNVSIETPSELPTTPVGPARVRNILLSFLFSLTAAIGLSILLQKFDNGLEKADEITLYTQLPILAVVPATRRGFLSLRKKEAGATLSAGDSTSLALLEDGRSPSSEAYRHLRTALLKSSNINAPRSILVTSGKPLEGKTTTAVNAATIFALTGKKVLLMDCDLRRPRAQTHFGFSESPGLTDYLTGKVDVQAALRTYSKLPNLKIMTAGQVPSNPAELLGSDEMFRLVEMMSRHFDHVIIDSPPAISFTDAAILSTFVDGVLIVVREGTSSRKIVGRVKQQLLDLGANIYGLIINNAKTDWDEYYYDGHYTGRYRNSVPSDGPADLIDDNLVIESSEIELAFKKFRPDNN